MKQLDVIGTLALSKALPSERLSDRELILAAMRSREPYVLRRSEIEEMLWADDLDGGPEFSRNVISIHVHRLRQLGHLIEGWHGIGYRLIKKAQNPVRQTRPELATPANEDEPTCADERAARMTRAAKHIAAAREAGITRPTAIVRWLNASGIKTPAGLRGPRRRDENLWKTRHIRRVEEFVGLRFDGSASEPSFPAGRVVACAPRSSEALLDRAPWVTKQRLMAGR